MVNCNKCYRDIGSGTPVARFDNKDYHPDCLLCKMCRTSVSGKKFLVNKDGSFTCVKCDEIYGPHCRKCKRNFPPGKPFKKLDENTFFHTECFTCAGPCGMSLGNEFYDLENDSFVCENCYNKYGAKAVTMAPINNNRSIPKENIPREEIEEAVLGARQPSPVRSSSRDYIDNKLSSSFTSKLTTKDDREVPSYPHEDRPTSRPVSSRDISKNTDDELRCYKCKRVINGTYSVHDNNNYHTECFTCQRCSKPFKERKIYNVNGEKVCIDCNEKHIHDTATKCVKCRKPILDSILTCNGQTYHESCLTCYSCDGKLKGQSIYPDKSGRLMCIDCYTRKEARKCYKCRRAIAPNVNSVVFENNDYHPDCFSCDKCTRVIYSDERFFKGEKGEILCQRCS